MLCIVVLYGYLVAWILGGDSAPMVMHGQRD
jgi:hypothetical protein